MIKYIQQEMADVRKTGEKKSYYRIPTFANMSYERLLDDISHNRGMINRGVMKAAVEALVEGIAAWVSAGRSVTVDGLGTFRASVGVVKGKEVSELDGDEARRNAQSICVRNVLFKADKQLVRNVNNLTYLERGPVKRIRKVQTTREERRLMAVEFLAENGMMRVADYAALTGLCRTSATKELRELAAEEDTGIVARGRGSHRLYFPA